jgi:hypothetical protein
MISRSEISDRVKSLAASIHADYRSERPVMVCVLKGANPVSDNDPRIKCVGCTSIPFPIRICRMSSQLFTVFPAFVGGPARVEAWVYR